MGRLEVETAIPSSSLVRQEQRAVLGLDWSRHRGDNEYLLTASGFFSVLNEQNVRYVDLNTGENLSIVGYWFLETTSLPLMPRSPG